MKTQKRHSETLPSKYMEKKLAELINNEEDVGSHDSDSTCEEKEKEKLACPQMFPRSKLKVELCRNFLENKLCPYRSRCKFAHGLEELLLNEDLSQNFRTKKCKIFFDKKCCRFGERCNFKHCGSREQELHNIATSAIFNDYPEVLMGMRSASRVCQQAQGS